METAKERLTLQELASKFELQENQITLWKKELLNNAGASFERESKIDDSGKRKTNFTAKLED